MADHDDLEFALAHFRRRAEAQERAQKIAGELRAGGFRLPGTRKAREAHARTMIAALRAVRDAGRMTFPVFLRSAGFQALEIVHSYRFIEGEYAAEMDPIDRQLDSVRAAHGLRDGEYWPKSEGPTEWRELNAQWGVAFERQQVRVLRELGLDDLAHLLESDSERFHNLWLQSIEAVDEYLPPRERLVSLIDTYRKEAGVAEDAGAVHAAVALGGAVLEGLLLLRCISEPDRVASALESLPSRERPRGLPNSWTLGQLVKVATLAGWLSIPNVEGTDFDPAIYAHVVADLRNMLHPGRRLRSPETEITQEEVDDVRAALVILETLLEELDQPP